MKARSRGAMPLIGEVPCRCDYKWHLWHLWRPCGRKGWEILLGYCDRCAGHYG